MRRGLNLGAVVAVRTDMSPLRSRSNLLDVLPDSSSGRREEVSGVHEKHPATSAVAALLEETLCSAELEETPGTANLDETLRSTAHEETRGSATLEVGAELADVTEHAVEEVEENEVKSLARASLPPLPISSRASVVGLALGAFGVVAVGLVIGPFFMRSPAPSAAVTALSTQAKTAPSTAYVPEVSIPNPTEPTTATPAVTSAAASAPAAAAPGESAPSASESPPTLADAEWMLRHGQVPRAEAMYRSILASGGSEHEALTGLGKVAIYNRRPAEALSFFERALARQPHYFPARLGRADALWDAGRRDAAKAQYAIIREGHPDNTIPARIVERARR